MARPRIAFRRASRAVAVDEPAGDDEFIRLRRFLAEFLGTFCLTFVAAGGATIAAVSQGGLGGAAIVVAPGLLVTTMIYTLGPTSGAHLNPVVTLAFAIRGNFPWRRVPDYWVAQFLGGILAALLVTALFGSAGRAGVNVPHYSIVASVVLEIFLTLVLVTVILATAANYKIVGHNAALAVGAAIILAGLFAAPISGASMNPARSAGPAVVTEQFQDLWIYFVGPILGSIIAVGIAWLLRGPGSHHGAQVATGEET